MINSIELLKLADKTFGPFLFKIIPPQKKRTLPASRLKKILVIRPGGLGDAFLLLPTLKAAYQKHKIKIDVLCEPRNKTAFLNVVFLNTIYSYKSLSCWKKILGNKYDLIVDTEQSHFLSAIMTRFLNANHTIGFKTNNRNKMYNFSLPYDQQQYEANMFWKLFTLVFDIGPEFSFDYSYFDHKESLTFENNIVCFFPGASIKPKQWPEERWAKIIDWVAQKGFKPILLGSFSEKQQCKKIMSLTQNNKTSNMCCKLSIYETAILFQKTKLLISTDSSILHLGVISNVSTLSIFGPSNEKKWAPKGKNHHVIKKSINCRPCTLYGTTPPCTNDLSCMTQISVDDVVMVLKGVLK